MLAAMEPSGVSRRFERRLFAGALLLELVTLALALLAHPRPRSLLAPVVGPWAGFLYGHGECSMVNALPLLSWTIAGALPLAAAGIVLARGTAARPVALLAFVLVLGGWCVLALLSIANTLE